MMGFFQALRTLTVRSKAAKAFSGFDEPWPAYSIWTDAEQLGVSLDPTDPETSTAVCPWAEVTRVLAFKRDLLTTDLLCLRLEMRSGTALEVNEEMPGWSDLLEVLHDHLPGCLTKAGILESVLTPAFASKETVVYRSL